MTPLPELYASERDDLCKSLAQSENLLIIQDLDGVCMGLVRDPLTRTIDRGYVEAARRLAGHFYVLTNGEHVGARGVNTLVERAAGTPQHVREAGLYLPGLGAGGVQLQDRHGNVSHPGVTDAEISLLRSVPDKVERFLSEWLSNPAFDLQASRIRALVQASVLDNPLSPTVNLNVLHQFFRDQPSSYRALQNDLQTFMNALLHEADRRGLPDAFFVHYAPNLGRDAKGIERISPGDNGQAGTTDIQLMLKGGVKEAGVLTILNQYIHARSGVYPFGEKFNARQAPDGHQALLQLARDRIDPEQMPRIVGVGDTLTSQTRQLDGEEQQLRGGSDRGFLQLVQDLGHVFHTGNTVMFVDSSGGEVPRPHVDAALLQQRGDGSPDDHRWTALSDISDARDPLQLDVIFPAGHAQYVDFFRTLSDRWTAHASARQ